MGSLKLKLKKAHKVNTAVQSRQGNFIYIALYTIQIVSKQYSDKQKNNDY